MKLLYLAPRLPHPPDNGGNIRILNLLKYLSRNAEVDMLCFSCRRPATENVRALQAVCRHFRFVPIPQRTPVRLAEAALRSLGSGLPLTVLLDTYSQVFDQLRRMDEQHRYDGFYFDFLHTGQYLLHCRSGGFRILGLHNIESEIWHRLGASSPNPLKRWALLWQAGQLRRYERLTTHNADLVTTVCSRDQQSLQQNFSLPKHKTLTVDIGMDMEAFPPIGKQKRHYLVFVGSLDWMPNRQAVDALLHPELIEHLRNRGLTLRIVGKVIPDAYRRRAEPGVEFLENVPDLGEIYRTAVAMLVPLRSGGGTRVKIRESLAYGVPVVSTRIGAEGVNYTPGHDLIIAETLQELQHAVNRLSDPQTWAALSSNGLALIRSEYNAQAIAEHFAKSLRQRISLPTPSIRKPYTIPPDGITQHPEAEEPTRNYLAGHNERTCWSDPRWAEVFFCSYGLKTHWLTSWRGGRVVGVLPLVEQRGLAGSRLASLPWFDAAGIVADDDRATADLHAAARGLMHRLGVGELLLRHEQPLVDSHATRTDKVTLRLSLPADPEELWSALKAKVRNQVRKAEKAGLVVVRGGAELMRDFHAVYSRTMRDLGSPCHSLRFFRWTARLFADELRITTVRLGSLPVAAGLTLRDRLATRIPWAGADWRHRKLNANMLMYWELLAEACRDGSACFDFGRSTRDAGTYKFKKQWGAEEIPLYWQSDFRRPTPSKPHAPTDSPAMQRASRIWQQLPLPLANQLGPLLIRQLP